MGKTKIIIGTGIGVLLVVAVLVSAFTNIGDLTSKEIVEFTSKIEVTNPIQPYKINTECDLAVFFNEPGNAYDVIYFFHDDPRFIVLKNYEKYINNQLSSELHSLIQEVGVEAITKIGEEVGVEIDEEIDEETISEISAEIIAEEYSINPVLMPTLIDLIGQTATEWNAKLKTLGSNCDTHKIFENQKLKTYHVPPKNPMQPTLQDGDDVVVDKTVKLTDLKEGDIIAFKSPKSIEPVRYSRVIAVDPDSGDIRTKLDWDRATTRYEYPNDKNEFIGKVTEIIRDGKKIPLPPYEQSNKSGLENAGVLGSDHAHAAILVKIFGDKFGFSLPAYQIQSSWIHFEGQDGNTIHKHATGVTLGYLFETLGIGLTDECYVFQYGREFCTNQDYSLKFYINGQQIDDIRDYEISENDKILISYGDETPEEIDSQLTELENQYSLQSDTSESGDVEKLSDILSEEKSSELVDSTQAQNPSNSLSIDTRQGSPLLGSPDAPVTIVEFCDYQDRFCKMWNANTKPTVEKNLIETGKVNLIYVDFEVIGPDSLKAHAGSYCAAEQGLYWQYHDHIYANQGHENDGWAKPNNLKLLASGIAGLNPDLFSECLDSEKYEQRIRDNTKVARDSGIRSTPSFIVIGPSGDSVTITGAQPYEVFQQTVDNMLDIQR